MLTWYLNSSVCCQVQEGYWLGDKNSGWCGQPTSNNLIAKDNPPTVEMLVEVLLLLEEIINQRLSG